MSSSSLKVICSFLLFLLTLQVALINAVNERALIISNENDLASAKLISDWLRSRGIGVEISDEFKEGYNYYFILGGPKADRIGAIASKFLTYDDKIALLNSRDFWTFSITTKGGIVVSIAGSTRNETLKGTKALIDIGILDFLFREEASTIQFKGREEKLSYSWEFPPNTGRNYSISIEVPEDLVTFFRVKPRMKVVEFQTSSPLFTWYLMLTTPHDDQIIKELAEKLDSIAEREGMRGYDRVWFVASFVQSLKYSQANEYSPTGDYPSYPLETLERGNGDCEDLSILLASLLRHEGFDSILLIMPTHAAVAVSLPKEWVKLPRVGADVRRAGDIHVALVDLMDLYEKIRDKEWPVALEIEFDNKSYFYVETTGFFKPGELPNLLQLAEAIGWPYRDFPIFLVSEKNSPIPLIYDYLTVSRKTSSGYSISLIIKLRNLGEKRADDLRLDSQLYPLGVEAGGVDANLRRLDPFEYRFEVKLNDSIIAEPIDPNGTAVYSVKFFTVSPTVGARVSLYLGSSEVDFLRIRPFRP
jgi:hypothetical protein